MIIGLSGLAGSGKDLFFSLLCERIRCKRFSLADDLKRDVRSFCKSKYGIDPLNCSREEKGVIRPFLIFHGAFKRRVSNGRHWIDSLDVKIKKHNLKRSSAIITDIRYSEFPRDEIHWLKEELNGKLIHISLYDEMVDHNTKKTFKSFLTPPNIEEETNDPILKENADYVIEWKREVGTPKEIKAKLTHEHIEPFIFETGLSDKYMKK